MLEFLTNLLITTACSALGFVAGMMFMRDNYIEVVQSLKRENKELKDGMYR